MKRIRIFLDTSVISHLDHSDRPDWTMETLRLWDILMTNKYDVFISSAVLRELDKCTGSKRNLIFDYLAKIEYNLIEINKSIEVIAEEIINLNILTSKHLTDCLHIGAAIHSNCKYLISWNFDDLVNIDTNDGVRMITHMLHYPSIDIISPYSLRTKED